MTRQELVHSAAELVQPDAAATGEFAGRRDALESALADALRNTAAPGLYPAELEEMMRDNLANHFRYLESVFLLYDPESFVETLAWVFRTYLGHGVRPAYWDVMLPECLHVLQGGLSESTFVQIRPFYDWMIGHAPHFVRLAGEPGFWDQTPGTGGGGHGG